MVEAPMDQSLPLTLGVFLLLALTYVVLERLWPARPAQKLLRRGWRTDALYWLFTPLVSRNLTRLGIGLTLAALLAASGAEISPETLRAVVEGRDTWFSTWPWWLQGLGVLFVSDFTGYWLHRLFHRGWWWRVHAVHHSPTELDWLAATRLHPLNELLSRMVQVVPFYLLGFSPLVLASVAPLLSLYAILLHANVSWSFGPLRFVIASPAFHRWHHSREPQALDKNFAGLFPLWDFLFGTLYLQHGQRATDFGITSNDMPPGLWGQLLYPFARSTAPATEHSPPALAFDTMPRHEPEVQLCAAAGLVHDPGGRPAAPVAGPVLHGQR